MLLIYRHLPGECSEGTSSVFKLNLIPSQLTTISPSLETRKILLTWMHHNNWIYWQHINKTN